MRQCLRATTAALSLAGSPSAHAIVALIHQVDIGSSVSQIDANTWQYSCTLVNLSRCSIGNCGDTIGGQPINTYALSIRRFDLPYFADCGTLPAETLSTPADWTATLLTGTPFVNEDGSTLAGSMTLRWTATTDTSGVAAGSSLGGFGFKAPYGAGYAPFTVGFPSLPTLYGDPPIPLSPAAQAAGIQPLAAVPEPQAWLLMAIGLAGLGWRRARRAGTVARG